MAEIALNLPDDLLETLHYWSAADGRPIDEISRDLLEVGLRHHARARPKILESVDSDLFDPDVVLGKVIQFVEAAGAIHALQS